MKKNQKRIVLCFLLLFTVLATIATSHTDAAAAKQMTKVKEISFNNVQTRNLTLYKGQSYRLGTKVKPLKATKKKVNYKLSQKHIISINAKGKIKALKTGSVNLLAKSTDNSKIIAKLKIKVISKKKFKTIKSIIPQKKSITLEVGSSKNIPIQIKPVKASNKNLQFFSTNSQIIKVSNEGKITALKKGKAKVIIQALDGSKKQAKIKVTVTEKISPVAEYINLEIHQKDTTVTEMHPILKGTIFTNGKLKAISYKIWNSSIAEKNAKVSSIEVSEDGIWEIPKLTLSPGVNQIAIKAETYSGSIAEKTVMLTYNRGTLDDKPQMENIHGAVIEEDGKLQFTDGVSFVNNRLLLYFKENISPERKKEIFEIIGAVEIGSLHTIQLSQIELYTAYDNIQELYAFAKSLTEKYDEILAAEPEWIMLEAENTTYNDFWNLYGWDVYEPEGKNWWAEVVNAPLAWDYAKEMKPVKIGIIDNGFDVEHEDLEINFSNEERRKDNSIEKHGTHVAGIIGATANNGRGLTGLAWMNAIYGYDWKPDENQNWLTSSKIQDLYVEAVEDGCKIINMSLGTSSNLENHTKKFLNVIINSWGRSTSMTMGKLLEQGFDFVIVQSAGNGAKDGIGVDAVNNGYMSSITEENCYHSHSVSKSDILNRILVVGAVEQKDGKYQQTKFSNGGKSVNIAAPGWKIYSTLPSNTYGELNGTSMAAPIVAATASMIWSVNHAFTGEEVQKILLEATDKVVYDHLASTETIGDLPIVNAGLAVEEAMRKSKKLLEEDAYHIVLTWKEYPEDLDAHLRTKDALGKDIHVYFGGDTYDEAELIWDDPSCYGPEVITIHDIEKIGEMYYAVHNYTDRKAQKGDLQGWNLSKAEACVEIYKGNVMVKKYQMPKAKEGTVWTVFSMDSAGKITDINEMGFATESTEVLRLSH